ncbi:MAG: hypothetical protein RLZZ153_1600 [Pseudomonadota bacterium]|jgi:hypothetical protein
MVREPWRKQIDQVTCLQKIDPGASRYMGYPSVITQLTEVEQLARTAGTKANEAFESLQIVDGGQLSEVSLNISDEIVRKRLLRA